MNFLTNPLFYLSDMYTIKFQKYGLPHAHLLNFLHPSNKYLIVGDIDNIIYAKTSCDKE